MSLALRLNFICFDVVCIEKERCLIDVQQISLACELTTDRPSLFMTNLIFYCLTSLASDQSFFCVVSTIPISGQTNLTTFMVFSFVISIVYSLLRFLSFRVNVSIFDIVSRLNTPSSSSVSSQQSDILNNFGYIG